MSLSFTSKITAVSALVMALAGAVPAALASDAPAFHGMLVFGTGTIYLSHLPMFHSPHDYQAIVEADFDGPTDAIYLKDRAEHPEPVFYTLAPLKDFVLPDEIQGLKSFKGALYRGHFERDGVVIASGFTVRIRSVVYFRHFDPVAVKPGTLTYLAFGKSGETYLAHLITAKPDFDQILAAGLGAPFSQLLARSGQPYLELEALGQDDTQPLKDGVQAVRLTDLGAAGAANQAIEATAVRPYYLESGDLSQ